MFYDFVLKFVFFFWNSCKWSFFAIFCHFFTTYPRKSRFFSYCIYHFLIYASTQEPLISYPSTSTLGKNKESKIKLNKTKGNKTKTKEIKNTKYTYGDKVRNKRGRR